jgi:hypothetical protein
MFKWTAKARKIKIAPEKYSILKNLWKIHKKSKNILLLSWDVMDLKKNQEIRDIYLTDAYLKTMGN